jgi:hypothetical protein
MREEPDEPLEDSENSELLDKVDAFLQKHRGAVFSASPTPAVSAEPALPHPEPTSAPMPADAAEIPVLTEIVAEKAVPVLTEIVELPEPVSAPAFDEAMLRELEERLARDLENRLAPQLSAAFDRALGDLLEQSRTHISRIVREAVARELQRRPESPGPADSGDGGGKQL